jgi:diphthine-ammonia ligase
MTESLNVIALISGGKDSFFSLLHCVQNGHKVLALGNLYPAAEPPGRVPENDSNHAPQNEDDERDLNSFMYQTVGHTVIPLYEQALGIPLYRQPIVGTAIQTGTSYGHSDVGSAEASTSNLGSTGNPQPCRGEGEDETESLVPLLRRIMADHPTANALSTGAILSTYQRTRIESVALRLRLTPLAYLWKYPILPPGAQSSLLEDMQATGLDARIVKVASGGLDESFLWQNVASKHVIRRIERSIKRFGTYGDGAVLGEGGEFETLVIDGPASLFKGRIEVQENDKRIVREGGGSAWLQIRNAKVIMKDSAEGAGIGCRSPDLLDPIFSTVFKRLIGKPKTETIAKSDHPRPPSSQGNNMKVSKLSSLPLGQGSTIHWTIAANGTTSSLSITEEAGELMEEIRQRLHQSSLQPTSIISSIIVLSSMQDFSSVNKVLSSQHNPINHSFL